MKKIVLVLFFVFSALPTQAQFFNIFSKDQVINNPNFDMQRFSWGYFLGFNTYDFDFDYYNYIASPSTGKDYSVDRTIGFNVGLIGNMRLSEHLDLRLEPGVSFNRINFVFNKADPVDTFREINSTFVHVPLLLKFSTTRINNYKPFVVGGVSTSLNLSSNENNPDDNYDRQFRMTTNNYYYEIGFGIDLYLYYFKFTPSIRGIFAINDELVRDDNPDSIYTGNVDKMSSRGLFINFTFQ